MSGSSNDEYHWYREAIVGRIGPIHEGNPQPGFYAKRSKPYYEDRNAPFDRCAIWRANGVTVGAVNGIAADPNDLWIWCAKLPIPEELYRHHEAHGEWPNKVNPKKVSK